MAALSCRDRGVMLPAGLLGASFWDRENPGCLRGGICLGKKARGITSPSFPASHIFPGRGCRQGIMRYAKLGRHRDSRAAHGMGARPPSFPRFHEL